MARIRTLKPELLEDARTAGLSDAAFRLFVSAVLLADDHGNLRADERWLDGQIWWAHDGRGDSRKSAASLLELAVSELVVVYRVRGQSYLSIRSWQKHQRIDNAGKPRVPLPSDPEAEVLRNFAANLRETPLYLRPPTSEKDPEGDPDMELAATSAAPSVVPQVVTSKPVQRVKRDRGTLVPDDWEPERSQANEQLEAEARAAGIHVRNELARMRDWSKANGKKGIDWNAKWRNWLREAIDRKSARPRSNQPTGGPSPLLLAIANGDS